MATKNEELINSLQREATRVLTLLEGLQAEIREADLQEIRERLRELETRLSVVNIGQLLAQIATLQEQVSELKKWREERERRSWQFWLGVGICALTFTANLVMNFLLYFARKPG